MRSLLLVAIAACTSTRQLKGNDLGLTRANHHAGWVVPTTGMFHERIDPNTELRFRNAAGGWTDPMTARDLRVDATGAWLDYGGEVERLVSSVRIDAVEPAVIARLEATRPEGSEITVDAHGASLSSEPIVLTAWLDTAFARVPRRPGALGTWTLEGLAPMSGDEALVALHRPTLRGWQWDDIAEIEVRNLSGSKTLGAIIGYSALTVALLPFALLLHGSPSFSGPPGPGGGGPPGPSGEAETPRGTWTGGPSPTVTAPPLFSTGADVRAVVQPLLVLDGAASRDFRATGAIAKIRIGQLFEIGGGVRETFAAGQRSTTGVFQAGFHLPLDAGMRVAIPLGFEAGGGGNVARDLRLPWGIRYNADRWFVTALPATPSYFRLHDNRARWSLAAGLEVGALF